ncbi:MAG: hypothetical protein AAF298_20810 [Cyanobacteria bacterium P01_A01_bin.40]
MNSNLSLLKIIPLMTLLIGLLAPVKIVKAASGDLNSKDFTKQETLNEEEQNGENQVSFGISQLVASQAAQKIVWFSFLTLTVCNLYSKVQSAKNKNHRVSTNKIEPDIPSFKLINKNPKILSLVVENVDNSANFNHQERIALEHQSEPEREAA